MDVEIYVGGGQSVTLVCGDQLEFSLSQISAKLNVEMEGVDGLENIKSALCIGRRNENITDDEIVSELKEWAGADDRTFMTKAIRKFRLFWPYSTALRGIFFDRVDYYKLLVGLLLKKLGVPEMKKAMEDEYAESKTKSSSPLLYGFGKYEPLNEKLGNKKLETNHKELLEYIRDPKMWEYPGFCPFVSTTRFSLLCKFPVELISDILGDEMPEFKCAIDPNTLTRIEPPEMPTSIVEHEATGLPIDLAKAILARLEEHKDIIHKWETYYVECAKQVSQLKSS